MSSEQKIDFAAKNLTKSLLISRASFVEYEKQIKDSAGSVRISGVYRDYIFTVNNLSPGIIDAIVITFRQNDALKTSSVRYYRYGRNGLHPQESDEIQVTGVESDYTSAVEAIVFRNNSYEGNPVLAEACIARYDTAKAKISELMTLVVDPKNWTVIFKPDTVQKGGSTDAKTSYFQT